MTVAELIAKLKEMPQDVPVRFFRDWEDEPPVDSVANNADLPGDPHVLIGFDLPSECYASDYKYER